MNLVELERLLVQLRSAPDAFEFPRGDVREIRVVAQRLALRRLAFLAEMAAARFLAVQGVERQQFGEFEVVGDAAGISRLWFMLSAEPGTDTLCQNSSRSFGNLWSSARCRLASVRAIPTSSHMMRPSSR